MPSERSIPPIRSESCSFIWHPKVRIRNILSMRPRLPPLPRELRRARLPDHRDLDLPGVLELLLDLLRDVTRDRLRLEVVDVLRRHQHADLAAGLHREDLLDALVRRADLLQPLQALDVGLERLTTGAGAAAADRVGDLRQHRVDRPLLDLSV